MLVCSFSFVKRKVAYKLRSRSCCCSWPSTSNFALQGLFDRGTFCFPIWCGGSYKCNHL